MMARRPKWLVFLLLFVLMSWGGYHLLFKGKMDQIRKLHEEKALIEREIRGSISGGEAILQEEDVGTVHQRLQKQIAELSRVLPNEAEVPALFHRFLSQVKEVAQVEYREFKPGETKDEGKYRRLPLKMFLMSDFNGLDRYLAELEKLPVITHVDRLVLKQLESDAKIGAKDASALLPWISSELDLSVFVFPGGTPEKSPNASLALSAVRDPFYSDLLLSSRVQAASPPPAEVLAGAEEESTVKEKGPILRYQGFWDGRHPKAFINGVLVSAGDRIEGYTVMQIREDSVELWNWKNGEAKTLSLEE